MAKKILFINQEIAPYVPNSELSRIYDLALSNNIEINNKLKLFVIDDVDHSIMLLAEEY